MWLSKRNSQILSNLTKIYIATHKPVSSSQLAPTMLLSCSALRKELQKLESFGFIYKPSSSSGRIPTNKGLRYYLRELLKNQEIEKMDFQLPDIKNFDFKNISENLLTLLSENTHNIGFLFLNSIFDLKFNRIKLFKIGSHRIMTVLHSTYDWSFSKIFHTNENYSETDIKKWESILNKEFRGRTLQTTFRLIRNRLFKEKEKYQKIYKELYFLLSNKGLKTAELFYKGTLNILNSDIIDPHKVKKILETLEDRVKLSRFLDDILQNNQKSPIIALGAETGITELEDFILILSNFYLARNPIGNIGIIGPKFMPYPHSISRVEAYSAYFSDLLSKKPLEV